MRHIAVGVIGLWLTASAAMAQLQTNAETKYYLGGVDSFQVVGEDLLVVPEGTRPTVRPFGYVVIDSQASIIQVRAERQDRSPVEVRKLSQNEFGILDAGLVWVNVTAVDFELEIFEQNLFVLDIEEGGEPDDPDEPDGPDEPDNPSDVPADAFDNLGRRIDAQADQDALDAQSRDRLAGVLADVAEKMEARRFIRSQDAKAYAMSKISDLSLGQSFQAALDIMYRDGAARAAMDWQATISWYKAAAAGFKGGAL